MLGESAHPEPTKDCCILYADKFYGGNHKTICHDGTNAKTVQLYDSPYWFND